MPFNRPRDVAGIEREMKDQVRGLRRRASAFRRQLTRVANNPAAYVVTKPEMRDARQWAAETLEAAAKVIEQALFRREMGRAIEKAAGKRPAEP